MPTLRDVAKVAGVSPMTVSNVINGRQGKVSAATTQRVKNAIAELGYVPNAQARALAGASSGIIALLYGVKLGDDPLGQGHDSLFVGACETACQRAGLAVMLLAYLPGDEERLIRRLKAWNVAGVIGIGTTLGSMRERMAKLGLPVVLVDTPAEPDSGVSSDAGIHDDNRGDGVDRGRKAGVHGPLSAPRVAIDDDGGGELAGQKLRSLGHRRVVFAGPCPDIPGVDSQRLAGLRRGLGGVEIAAGERDATKAAYIRLVRVPIDYAAGLELGQRLAGEMTRRGETAVFASGDLAAMGIVAGLKRAGVRVPEDVSVVGFDGFEVSTYCDPVLTTVVQPVAKKASSAVDLMLSLLDEEDVASEVSLSVTWRDGGTLAVARS